MAAMEFHCTDCNWVDFSNDKILVCPTCGVPVVGKYDEEVPFEEMEEVEDEL